ncbi:MAG: hypothetical protein WB239_14625 [Acidimicrobiia bacterium]
MSTKKRLLRDILGGSAASGQTVDEGYNGWEFVPEEPNEGFGDLYVGPRVHLAHHTSPDNDCNHRV